MDMEMTYICGSCGRGFKRSDNLKKHLLVHTGIRPFQCSVCGKSFRERNHLSSHILLHTGEKPYKCSHCGKAFNQNSNLKKHIKIHLNDRPHVCNLCDNRFTQQCYLNEHMKTHTGERSYVCGDCGKMFKNSSHLRSHMKTHSDERPYKCPYCDKTFKYIRNYSLHIVGHDGDTACSCSECGKTFMNRNNLKIHMLSHTNIKIHECFVCGKVFQKLDKFRRHLQVHTGERPFTCSLCEEGFKNSAHLKFHMMLHTGELPFTCEVCGSGFRSKSYLNSHMVSHNRNRHECSVCGKSFKYKCNYTRHMRTHTGEESQQSFLHILAAEQNSLESEHGIVSSDKGPPVTHLVNSDDLDESVPIVTEGEIVEEDQRITVISCSTHRNDIVVDPSGYVTYGPSKIESEASSQASVKILMKSSTTEYPFHCMYCTDTFRQEDQIKEHLKIHSNDPHQCHLCKVYFSDSDLLQAHLERHMSEQSECVGAWNVGDHKCKKCGIRFQRKYLLRRHMHAHMNTLAFECAICKKRFKDKSVLKTHTMIHTERKKYACYICDKKFMHGYDQKRHMKMHDISIVADDKHFSCNVCGLRFSFKHNLETHKMIHVMREDAFQNDRQEDGCASGNVMSDKNIIHALMGQYTLGNIMPDFDPEETVTHIITEEEMDSKAGITQIDATEQDQKECEMADERMMNEPETNAEDDDLKRKYACIICGEDCMEQAILKAHMKHHKLECPQCGKAFNRLNNLKRHMVIHSGVRPYQCIQCDKKFKESGHLKSHFMLVHSEKHSFECEFCSKKFVHKSNYVRHLKTHAGEKQTCEAHEMGHATQKSISEISDELPQETALGKGDIDAKFLSSSELISDCVRIVMNDAEAGNEPEEETVFKCSMCVKDFSKKSNLKRHIMIHTGERPYDCSSCGKRFKEKKCRDEHKMAHSGIRPHVCNICNKRFTQKSVLNRHRKSHGVVDVSYKTDDTQETDENVAEVNNDITTIEEKSNSVRIPQGNVEVTNEILSDVTEPTVEIQVGKIAIQTISYEAAMKRRQILKERMLHKCTICSKMFNRKSNLARHVQAHKDNPGKSNLARHVEDHKDNPGINCNLCESTFKTKYLFDRHMLTHSSKYTHRCNKCGKTFLQDELHRHMREHMENKDSSISDPISLATPSQNVGEKGESLRCSICGMKFHFKHHLENHRIIHELRQKIGYEKGSPHKIVIKSRGSKPEVDVEKSTQEIVEDGGQNQLIVVKEEPVVSDERNVGEMELGKIRVKTLPYRLALERRQKTRSNKKRVNCEICGKDFSSNYNLKVHMRLHSGEKPFTCAFCDRKFHQFNVFKNHMKCHNTQEQVQQLTV